MNCSLKATTPRAGAGPVSQLQQHLERISQLPRPKQRMLFEMIDAVLSQEGR